MPLVDQIPQELAYAVIGAAALGVARFAWTRSTKAFTKARRHKRNRELELTFDDTRFSLGTVQLSVFVADYKPDGYDPALIKCELGARMNFDTAIYGEDFRRHHESWSAMARAGNVFNGPVLALSEYRIDRSAHLERAGLRLQFAENDYVTQRAVADCYRGLDSGEQRLQVEQMRKGVGDAGLYSATFGVSLAVITSDDMLIWLRRSEMSAVNSGLITCTTAEGMNRDDIRSGLPDPYLCADRGLHEELGLRLSNTELPRIHLTALTLNLEWWEWNLLGHLRLADLPEQALDSHAIRQYFTSAVAKDKWETAQPVFTAFEPDEVARFVHDNDVTNYAVASAILALLSDPRFRLADVEKAFSRT